MRALAYFIAGLIAPALALAIVAPAEGQSIEIPPLPAPPASAARDPDALCAAVFGDGLWRLCRMPTGEEARQSRLHGEARRYFHARLSARYGGERMADLAIDLAQESSLRLSRGAWDRRQRHCMNRARRGR